MKKLKLEELGRIDVASYRLANKMPIVLVLDNLRSLHNVGSVFRSADAFSVEKLYLTGITGMPPHREIHKTALGATESVAWEHASDPLDTVRELKLRGYRIIIIEQTTESVRLDDFRIHPGEKYSLIFGNEIHGVSESVMTEADAAIEVPQTGTKHSLNVSVCAGVVLWEFYRKLSKIT